jgi:hypothetical protein
MRCTRWAAAGIKFAGVPRQGQSDPPWGLKSMRLFLTLALLLLSSAVRAQSGSDAPEWLREGPGAHWRMMGSPFTQHIGGNDKDLHEYVYMIGLERDRGDGWVWGGAYFSNSFGQPSAYGYFGKRYMGFFEPWPELFAQWTLGIVYGYKEPFEDKIPLNHNGFAPSGTLSLGWQFTRNFSMQANLLGTAAVMLQMSWDFK